MWNFPNGLAAKNDLIATIVSKPFLSSTYVILCHVISQNCHVYHFTWYFVSMICCCFRLDMYIFSATASLLADKTNECIAISRKNYVIHTCVTRRHMPFHVKMICYCCCFCLCSSISNIFPQTSATVASSQTSMVRLTTAKLLNHLDSYLQTVLWFNFTRFFFVFFFVSVIVVSSGLNFLDISLLSSICWRGKNFFDLFFEGPNHLVFLMVYLRQDTKNRVLIIHLPQP